MQVIKHCSHICVEHLSLRLSFINQDRLVAPAEEMPVEPLAGKIVMSELGRRSR